MIKIQNKATEAAVSDIKASLTTNSTATDQTLRLLRAVLGLSEDAPQQVTQEKKASPPKSAKRQAFPPTISKTQRSGNSNPGTLKIHEDEKADVSPLPSPRRKTLATEVFNTSLKILSIATKNKLAKKSGNQAGQEINRREKARRTLQQCSPNRQRAPRGKPHVEETTPKGVLGADLWKTAECACLALETLRHYENEEDSSEDSGSVVERGAVILLDKLITLDLIEQAMIEARHIHEQYWKRRKQHGRRKSGQILVDLLSSLAPPESKADFDLISSFQAQVLRIMVLQGDQVVSTQFLNALSVKNACSPGFVILESVKKNSLSEEKAGASLLVLYQALSKIYTMYTTRSAKEHDGLLKFEAFQRILEHKFYACKFSKQALSSEKEVWAQFIYASKQFMADERSATHVAKRTLENAVERFENMLHDLELEFERPQAVTTLLLEAARPEVHDTPQVTEAQGKDLIVNQQLSFKEKINALLLSLQSYKLRTEECLNSSEEVLRDLNKAIEGGMDHVRATPLELARLRQAALKVALDVEQNCTQGSVNDGLTRLQVSSIRLLFANLRGQELCSVRLTSDFGDTVRIRFFTGFVKSIESVMQVEKCSITQSTVLSNEYHQALMHCCLLSDTCSSHLKPSMKDESVETFLKSIRSRVSASLWGRYLNAVSLRSASSELETLLELSIEAIHSEPRQTRRASCICLKYEKLALLHEDRKDYAKALAYLRKALANYIEYDTINDAVEQSLTKASRLAWFTGDTAVYALGKTLEKFASISIRSIADGRDVGWIWDDHSLPVLHRGVVIWKQVQGCLQLDMSPTQHAANEFVIAKVLHLIDVAGYQNLRLQIVSKYLFYRSKSDLPAIPMELKKLLADTLCEETDPPKSCLQSFENMLNITTNLQFQFLDGRSEIKDLTPVIEALKLSLRQYRTSKDLEAAVDDFEILVVQLRALVDVLSLHDHKDLITDVLEALQQLVSCKSPAYDEILIHCLTSLSSAYLLNANSLSAGKSLAQAEILTKKLTGKPLLVVDFSLAQAEYYHELSAIEESRKTIDKAEEVWTSISIDPTLVGNLPRLAKEKAIARASLLLSRIALTSGNHKKAYVLGRRAVKLSMSMYSSIAKQYYQNHETINGDHSSTDLADEMVSLTLLEDKSPPKRDIQGAAYWPYINLYTASLHNMVNLSTLTGLYQDAVYFAEQHCKMTTALRTAIRVNRSQAQLALVRARGGLAVDAGLWKADRQGSMSGSRLENMHLLLDKVELAILTGELSTAKSGIYNILEGYPGVKPAAKSPPPQLPAAKKKPRTAISSPRKPQGLKGKKQVQARTLRGDSRPKPQCVETSSLCIRWRSSQIRLARLQMELSSRLADSPEVEVISSIQVSNDPELLTSMALLKLKDGMRALSADAPTSVLPETALALPTRYQSTRRSGRISFVQGTADNENPQFVRWSEEHNVQASTKGISAQDLIQTAIQLMLQSRGQAVKLCPTYTLHTAYALLTKASLLGAALNVPMIFLPSRLILHSLEPKDEAYHRERNAVAAEFARDSLEDTRNWPDSSLSSTCPGHNSNFDPETLPETWSVVSISFDQDKEDLLVARLHSKRSPFIVRLPLSRSKDEHSEYMDMTYDTMKHELNDIIARANESAHDVRGQADKQTRKIWYEERERLDERLYTLLSNVENVWLGGFRGLLSAQQFNASLLSRFSTTLTRLLDTHLPSRQRTNRNDTSKVDLHAHVLELFVSAGHPDEVELDDTIMDLLYFVVDILQFYGERNAYDEIDFDALLVDVLDGLRAYHGACTSPNRQETNMHTILILDKELQTFPWESLPVMRGQSVSRLPCLQALQDRLAMIRAQSSQADAYAVPASNGSYMLNPSSDLISTQATFEPVFSKQLSNFSSSINKAPSEKEFETCLHDQELFLYFGHGSGAQYIRGRTIRKMDKCAVTLLMGCSSAKLTECGMFESYGVPWNYMHAGSPAVVGTLWDVTDRDIDRFAMSTMVEWGLIEEDENVENVKSKGKGRRGGKTKENQKQLKDRRGVVSLDEAVAEARESCMLKYLNGAAPVIYGVPVVLK